MSDLTATLSLPYLAASQAQKHVTHNEAIRMLDALVQPVIVSLELTEPPASPEEGDCYVPASGASGDWLGKDGQLACWQDGAWRFFQPRTGWHASLATTGALVRFDGSQWASVPVDAQTVGINTTADPTNRLAVASPASLFTHDGDGHQLKINKAAAGDTASLLFQTGYSSRAEIGLSGDDDLSVKVSADGTSFSEALSVSAATAAATFSQALTCNNTISSNSSADGSRFDVRRGGVTRAAFGVRSYNDDALELRGPNLSGSSDTVALFDAVEGFRLRTANTDRLRCDNDGDVCIGAAPVSGVKLAVAGTIAPKTDAAHDLGQASLRFEDIHAVNGVIQTSDQRAKEDIAAIPHGLDLIMALRPVSFRWKEEAGAQAQKESGEGPSARRAHFGLIAQDVAEALDAAGIDTRDFAPLVLDPDTGRYGLRYGEFIPILLRAVQELGGQMRLVSNGTFSNLEYSKMP